MRNLVKKSIALAIGIAMTGNTFMAETLTCTLGERVSFNAFMIRAGEGDASESLNSDYEADRGNASTSTGNPSSNGQGKNVDADDWTWADWVNDPSTWQGPVSDGNGLGSNGTGGNGLGGDGSSGGSGSTGSDISSLFPTLPTNKESLENMLDKNVTAGRGTTKSSVMTFDEFMKMIGSNNETIRNKYEQAKKDAKDKQKGDIDSAKDIYDKYKEARGGVNPWTGQPDTVLDPRDALDPVDSDPSGGSQGGTSGTDATSWEDFTQNTKRLIRDFYNIALENKGYNTVPGREADHSEYDKDRLIYDGITYENGKPVETASETVGKNSDREMYFYTDKDGNIKTISTGDIMLDYGSAEKAKEKLSGLVPVEDALSGKSDADSVSSSQKKALEEAGLIIKDENGSSMTVAQALKKYGSYDKMPSSVRSQFDQNTWLDKKLNAMYANNDYDDIYAVKEDKQATYYNDYIKMMEDFGVEYPSYDTLPDNMRTFISEDSYQELKETMKGTQAGDVSQGKIEDYYNNFMTGILNVETDYHSLPMTFQQRITEEEFDRINAMTPEQKNALTYKDINWSTCINNSKKGQADPDHTGTVSDAWIYCGECYMFYNSNNMCAHLKYNDADKYEQIKQDSRRGGLISKIFLPKDNPDKYLNPQDCDPTNQDRASFLYYEGDLSRLDPTDPLDMEDEVNPDFDDYERLSFFNPHVMDYEVLSDIISSDSPDVPTEIDTDLPTTDDLIGLLEEAMEAITDGEGNVEYLDKIQRRFDEESDQDKKDIDKKNAELDKKMKEELEKERQRISAEYEKYKDRLSKSDTDDLPEDPSLWTQEDIDRARDAIDKAYDETVPSPETFEDQPRIEDSPEYNEKDINKIIKDWPADRNEWTSGMKDMYADLVERADSDPQFAETLRAMIEAGVFDHDDPYQVQRHMQAFINGYTQEGTDYVTVYGTVTASEAKTLKRSKEYNVVGNPSIVLTCNTDPSYGVRNLPTFSWVADQIGTFTATGTYQYSKCHYEVVAYTAYMELKAVLPNEEEIVILKHEETVILEDQSGIKEDSLENRSIGTITIVVNKGNMDMNKSDFYNTTRIR